MKFLHFPRDCDFTQTVVDYREGKNLLPGLAICRLNAHTHCSRLSWLIIYEQPTAMRFLASPEGKLAWQIIGTSEPIICHDWWGAATAKSFGFLGWMVQSGTYTSHPAAFFDQPFAAPHQSWEIIGSEVPIISHDSFPPGEAKNRNRTLYHSTSRSIPLGCGRLAYAIWEPRLRLTFHRNICKMWK